MKVGDLVRAICPSQVEEEENWKGLVIGYTDGDPVVYWNDKFPAEIEYADQLEVLQYRAGDCK